jgi:hypothetical protein
MMHTTNINIAVDVVAALSNKSLKGNVFLMDNGCFESENQGTDSLATFCIPGQLIRWTVYAVDLQTPVAIKNITFLTTENYLKQQAEIPTEVIAPEPTVAPEEALVEPKISSDNKDAQTDLPTPPLDTKANQETIVADTTTDNLEKEVNQEMGVADNMTEATEKVIFNYDNLDRFDWTGYVPQNLIPGQAYHYRLELQMGEGKYSNLFIETSSLIRI